MKLFSCTGACIMLMSLTVVPMAQAEIVVVTSAKSSASSLTKEQTSDIFMGKSNTLPGGGAVTPVDSDDANPMREEFYNKVVGKSAAQVRSYWAKLSFTGKGTPPKEVGGSAEIKKALAGDQKLIGYIEKSAVDTSVKVIYTVQ